MLRRVTLIELPFHFAYSCSSASSSIVIDHQLLLLLLLLCPGLQIILFGVLMIAFLFFFTSSVIFSLSFVPLHFMSSLSHSSSGQKPLKLQENGLFFVFERTKTKRKG